MRFSFVVAAIALVLSPIAAFAEDAIGVITRLEGDATASKNGLVRSLEPGSEVFLSEVLSTGPETRLELVLTDDTRIILSDQTIASVADFAFVPAEDRGNAVISLLRGAFRAISGRIADMQDKELVFRTQAATIGIRGTDFFGGYEGRKLGVALLDEGSALSVENDHGSVDLAGQFQVTDVEPGMAPEAAHEWPQWRIEKSRERVAFFSRSFPDFDPLQNRYRRPD